MWLAVEEVRLTATEYRLREGLTRHAGAVRSTQGLLERMWGEDGIGDSDDVTVFIRRPRQMLGDNAERPTFDDNGAA